MEVLTLKEFASRSGDSAALAGHAEALDGSDPPRDAALSGGMVPGENPGRVQLLPGRACLASPAAVGLVPCETPPERRGGALPAAPVFFQTGEIARALGVVTRTIHNRAEVEAWPKRQRGARWEYAPPAEIAAVLKVDETPAEPDAKVLFTDLDERARDMVLARERAVHFYNALPGPRGEAAEETVRQFVGCIAGFAISTRSLFRWAAAHASGGLDGLVDQKKFRSGRKSAVSKLSPEEREEVAAKGKACTLQLGSAAKAAMHLSRDPLLPGVLRTYIHGGKASKSSVTPSIRKLITPLFSTAAHAQGPRAARLASPWTPGDWRDVKPGAVFTADDMTCNTYVWLPWNNEQGWRIVRPQLLAALDCGSLRWLTFRLVFNENRQYCKDDVWGLCGDVFDDYWLYQAALFEGGIWRSNRVVGTKTEVTDEHRFGGLRSLGVHLLHSKLPRSKPIETMFNQLQSWDAAVKGYCGRFERTDRPEALKRQLELCKSGRAHPSEFLLNPTEYADHLRGKMEEMNCARNDGIICRGLSPDEKFQTDLVPEEHRRVFPDELKWMYRSAFSVEQVTSNGVRVQRSSGKLSASFFWDNPELLRPLHGQRVGIYWNDFNPEADAAIVELRGGKIARFLGMARTVERIPRFMASAAQLSAEKDRKQRSAQMARTEYRSLSQHLSWNQRMEPVRPEMAAIGQALKAAENKEAKKDRAQASAGGDDAMEILLSRSDHT